MNVPIIIEEIKTAVAAGNYRISDHATKRLAQRKISRNEAEQAIATAQVLEEYPEDKYQPSCLVLGFTEVGRPLHIQLSVPPVVLVTIYEPDSSEWVNHRIRKVSIK